jgi:hypothetical protein
VNLWSESGDRDLDLDLDLEELTRGLLFVPRAEGLTGLTSANPLLGFARVNVLVSSLVFKLVVCFEFVSAWSSEAWFLGFGVSWVGPA